MLICLSNRGTMLVLATRMSACAFKQFKDVFLIDKRVLNPDSHNHVFANGMNTASAASQRPRNETIAEHQYSSKVLLSNCISRARFKNSSIRILFLTALFFALPGMMHCTPDRETLA